MDRAERITAALMLLADLITGDVSYIPIFERLDDELSLISAQPHDKIARARALIRSGSNSNGRNDLLQV